MHTRQPSKVRACKALGNGAQGADGNVVYAHHALQYICHVRASVCVALGAETCSATTRRAQARIPTSKSSYRWRGKAPQASFGSARDTPDNVIDVERSLHADVLQRYRIRVVPIEAFDDDFCPVLAVTY